MFVEALVFVFGLVLLLKGSEYFVESASTIATRLGVSEFMIGLTVVAFGTSVPELASTVAASLEGSSGIIIGNVIGSNIANIALIIGLGAVLTVVKTSRHMLQRDGYIMLFAVALFLIFGLDRVISRFEAGFMVLLYFVYILFLAEAPRRKDEEEHVGEFIKYFVEFRYLNTLGEKTVKAVNGLQGKQRTEEQKRLLADVIVLFFSGVAIVFGAEYMIREAIFFSDLFGVPETVIGIVVIGIGTSLPEVSVTLAAIKKGLHDVAVGNVLGSNIANVLLILGVGGLMSPLVIGVSTLAYALPFLVILSALFLWFIRSKWEIRTWEGAVLLTIYAVFLLLVVFVPGLAG